jgi:hypothetical protein
MGAPSRFHDDPVTIRFPGGEMTGTMLWQPGYLSQYGDSFSEECIELWAIESIFDDPKELASAYNSLSSTDSMDRFIDEHACVWLIYMYGTSWEIYARKPDLLKRLHDSLLNERGVAIFNSKSNRREAAFAAAGLSQFWRNIQGENG